MNPPETPATPPVVPPSSRPMASPIAPMPLIWRLILLAIVLGLTLVVFKTQSAIGPKGQAAVGIIAFFLLGAAFSKNLKAVNWRTIAWGIALQAVLAFLVIQGKWTTQRPAVEDGVQVTVITEYSVRGFFDHVGDIVKKFIGFTNEGSKFVFGNLYDARPALRDRDGKETTDTGTWSRLFQYDAIKVDKQGNPVLDEKTGKPVVVKDNYMFQFAFVALPPILFVSAFFTVLYHFGVLQWIVRLFARLMVYLLGTSGAETLSVSANVFMGQTEAPLIVKPYVPRMTMSELFTLMVSGMAHISGGMMAVYINYGADPVAIITTCIMACPCSIYLAKLILPETGHPETAGILHKDESKSPYVNAIDAAASGTGDGLRLAFNVAAMLIVFIAFIAMFDGLLGGIKPFLLNLGFAPTSLDWWPDNLNLRMIFGWIFSPAAMLMGVDAADQEKVGSLLGAKLSVNEHFAFLEMKKLIPQKEMAHRSFQLAAYALTGFANFASIGIQIGGIGAIAPERRHDLARLGGKALFAGFLATLLNAAVAGLLLD